MDLADPSPRAAEPPVVPPDDRKLVEVLRTVGSLVWWSVFLNLRINGVSYSAPFFAAAIALMMRPVIVRAPGPVERRPLSQARWCALAAAVVGALVCIPVDRLRYGNAVVFAIDLLGLGLYAHGLSLWCRRRGLVKTSDAYALARTWFARAGVAAAAGMIALTIVHGRDVVPFLVLGGDDDTHVPRSWPWLSVVVFLAVTVSFVWSLIRLSVAAETLRENLLRKHRKRGRLVTGARRLADREVARRARRMNRT